MEIALNVKNLAIIPVGASDNIVHPITFEIPKGTAFSIVGETGAGKSLIAQAILGNLNGQLAASGEIYLEGTELLAQPLKERQKLWGKKLGMLPQEPWLSLDPTQKIGSQVKEVYRHVLKEDSGESTEKTKEALSRFKLLESANKFPHQISGGMAQRAVFCCTMAGGTDILIVDEPTKGLDVDRKHEVISQLQKVLEKQGTLLVITHDVEVARSLGGQTVVMKKGIEQERNETETLFAAPQSTYAKELVAAVPSQWKELETNKPSSNIVISCSDIAKSFSKTTLFSDVSLRIAQGEIVGLAGPSGSGKSTLGDILLGLASPDSGTIERAGNAKSYQFLKLYQDPPASFSPFATMRSILDDLMALHSIERTKLDTLLVALKLDHSLLERTPADISGGELQRLAIARALLLDPVFLFADEPTSRLDPITQKETLKLLTSAIRENNCGMLLVSHDVDLLNKSCDRVISINDWDHAQQTQ